MLNNLAPGDMCGDDSECYAAATCQNFVCVAADANVGASCSDQQVGDKLYHGGDKLCAPGQYCMTDATDSGTATCQYVKEPGSICVFDDECGYTGVCLFNACQTWGTLIHGEKIED